MRIRLTVLFLCEVDSVSRYLIRFTPGRIYYFAFINVFIMNILLILNMNKNNCLLVQTDPNLQLYQNVLFFFNGVQVQIFFYGERLKCVREHFLIICCIICKQSECSSLVLDKPLV